MSKQVWIIFTKSEALDGCSIDFDGCNYYFAEAYVPIEEGELGNTSIASILDQVKEALLEDKLVLMDVLKCLRYKKDEWCADSEMEKEVHKLAAEAFSSGTITFSGFRSEEIQDLCRHQHKIYDINI